jgi:hypothetical protein
MVVRARATPPRTTIRGRSRHTAPRKHVPVTTFRTQQQPATLRSARLPVSRRLSHLAGPSGRRPHFSFKSAAVRSGSAGLVAAGATTEESDSLSETEPLHDDGS